MSRVSILIVALEAERFLEETLSSISTQTHKDIEVVLVDGGSTDNTVSVFEGFDFREGIDKKVVINGQETNIVHSFNVASEVATGDYVYQLCADDLLFDKDWLNSSCRLLDSNDNIDAVWGRTIVMRNAKEIIRIVPPLCFSDIPNGSKFMMYSVKYSLNPPDSTVVIRSQIYKDLFPRFDSSFLCDIYTPHHMFDYYFISNGCRYYFLDNIAHITRHIDDRRSVKLFSREHDCEKKITKKKRELMMDVLLNVRSDGARVWHDFSVWDKVYLLYCYIYSMIIPLSLNEYPLPVLFKKIRCKIFKL